MSARDGEGGTGLARFWRAPLNRWRARKSRASLLAEAEALRDEIWTLREAAAAQGRAEAASEAKSRFLATVSHEVRTPLNGVIGLADLLGGTSLDAEQRAYVDAIRSSGAALSSLIDEILDFSRIESGRLDLVEEPFDLAGLVEGAVELLAPRAQGKGIEIAASIAPDLPARFLGDAGRLRQALLNLAGNAVKFTDVGGVGVRVDWGQNGQLRFSVADTGPGVPPERRAAIFEEFEQGDGSASRAHEGVGLGLAITRRIAAGMGGALRLDHTSDKGSVFSLSAPLRALETPPAPRARLGGRSALIVGRSPFEAPFLGERLVGAGYEARRAAGEAAALEALSQRPAPDLVIVDCAMGPEVAARLAGAARAAGVAKSLVLFSPFERRAMSRASLDGFDGWLVKPVRSASLLARLAGEAGGPSAPAAATRLAAPNSGLRALLAEDDAVNALVARKHLERLGATVSHAGDGAEAVARASRALAGDEAPFDIALVDIRMPGLDGLETARRIRAAERLAAAPALRLIALTANVFEDDRRAALAAGFDVFLTKPVTIEALAKAIGREGGGPA